MVPGWGHPNHDAFCEFRPEGDRLVVEWTAPESVLLSLDLNGDAQLDEEEAREALGALLAQGFYAEVDGVRAEPELVSPPTRVRLETYTLTFAWDFPGEVEGFTLVYGLFDTPDSRMKGLVHWPEAPTPFVVTPESPSFRFEPPRPAAPVSSPEPGWPALLLTGGFLGLLAWRAERGELAIGLFLASHWVGYVLVLFGVAGLSPIVPLVVFLVALVAAWRGSLWLWCGLLFGSVTGLASPSAQALSLEAWTLMVGGIVVAYQRRSSGMASASKII